MIEPSSEMLHASCVAIDGRAVLIEGRSGAGKSDLTLRLVDRGAVLVSDDQTLCQRSGGTLHATAPDRIAGLIEVRGLGLTAMPFATRVPIALVVVASDQVPRLVEAPQTRRVAGVEIPAIALALLEPSAPIKVELALRAQGTAA